MHPNIEELTKETMVLGIGDRSLLADKRLFGFDESASVELEQLSLDEAERHFEKYRAGREQGIPADEVFRHVLAELS